MPLLPNDIANISNAQTAALNDKGVLAPAIRTSFRVRGQGPYYIELPKDGWSADSADKAIRAYAEQLVALIDKYPQG